MQVQVLFERIDLPMEQAQASDTPVAPDTLEAVDGHDAIGTAIDALLSGWTRARATLQQVAAQQRQRTAAGA